jgi:hypothetical protein
VYFFSLLIVDLNMLHLLLLFLSFLCYTPQELNAVSSLPIISAAVSNSAGYVYFLSLLIVDLTQYASSLTFIPFSLLCYTPQEQNAAAFLGTNHSDTNTPIAAAVRFYFMFPFYNADC